MSADTPSRGLIPTLIVPDEQTWTMLGHDPAWLGAKPSFEPSATSALLLPLQLPEGLDAPLAEVLTALPGGQRVHQQALDLPSTQRVREGDTGGGEGHAEHGEQAGHEQHGEGREGHGDMMAIVGEPSADGLVMESIPLRYGPLAIPFPGGLTVDATLDGDAVSAASVIGLASTSPPHGVAPSCPDPLSPAAWTAALAGADGRSEPCHPFAVELERAISHLAWLRALSRLLGWTRLTNHASIPLAELTALDVDAISGEGLDIEADARLDAALAGTTRLIDLLGGSRTLRWRLAGRGVVTPGRAEELGLDGPSARASGLMRDGRCGDQLYLSLGYEPLLGDDGDAFARTLLRAQEVSQSLELARAALASGKTAERPGNGSIEGPRGALRAERGRVGWSLSAPGSAAARTLAAEAMIGEPWQDALAVLASFDLSPWGPMEAHE